MLFRNLKCFNLFKLSTRSSYNRRVDPVCKRGSILTDMITNKDRKKGWHFHILKNTPKSRNVFEKVSKPSKRQNVLDALFIRNISDVIATGDVCPEVIGYGIEITGVKISPCCKSLNVYYRIPPNKYSEDETVSTILNVKATSIRAELISRNVMGKVPFIYFIRDTADAYMAAFEKALQEADLGPEDQKAIVPDDYFTSKKKKMYCFKLPEDKTEEEPDKDPKLEHPPASDTTRPQRPTDMRCDVFGLNHDLIMGQVLSQRLAKPDKRSHVIAAPDWDQDLFSRIPGETLLHEDPDRMALLKQFQVERKKMMRRSAIHSQECQEDRVEDDYEEDEYMTKEDFYEEEDSSL